MSHPINCHSAIWNRFKKHFFFDSALGFGLDISRVNFELGEFAALEGKMEAAFASMTELERGGIANPDENRMVGHYWLRDPKRSPSKEISAQIEQGIFKIKDFASKVHSGELRGSKGDRFDTLLLIGIGGSALGPQLIDDALTAGANDRMKVHYFDNTDPDGFNRTLSNIPDLAKTLVVVVSKSGGTRETRNGQLVARAAFERFGLAPANHFVAVTSDDSQLHKIATAEKWLTTFPMWDWVGGRTSLWGSVGLLPAALQGIDIEALLDGAREMDVLTRVPALAKNPAALLAGMWFHLGRGRGEKAMVVLPYKDRLLLFSRYLQQLVMESLGKERNLAGAKVNQGLSVYGNKGSTDQHAYVQQLRDGPNNFFAVFVEVLADRAKGTAGDFSELASIEVDSGVTSGDYLEGFFLGTRTALYENGRESISITLAELNAKSLGALLALFERAVGLYANLIGVNAYHQPGVEAGKRAATRVLEVQAAVLTALSSESRSLTVDELAQAAKLEGEAELVFKILRRLAANCRVRVEPGVTLFEDRYSA